MSGDGGFNEAELGVGAFDQADGQRVEKAAVDLADEEGNAVLRCTGLVSGRLGSLQQVVKDFSSEIAVLSKVSASF